MKYSLSPLLRHVLFFSLCIVLLLVSTGCSERLMRENVFANTETGVGIFLTQNAKTQLYEVKIGYLRHELFFVPTSKTITYQKVDGTLIEQTVVESDPASTPEVLADIAIGIKASDKKVGFAVRQRLAVGKIAVQTKSSIALMADDAATAEALSEATKKATETIRAITNPTPRHKALKVKLDELLEKSLKEGVTLRDGTAKPSVDAKADDIAEGLIPGKLWGHIRAEGPVDKLQKLVDQLEQAVE